MSDRAIKLLFLFGVAVQVSILGFIGFVIIKLLQHFGVL